MSETIDAIAKELERLEQWWRMSVGNSQPLPNLIAIIRYQWEHIDEWVPADITIHMEKEILAMLLGMKPKDDDPLTIKASVHNVISKAVSLTPAQEKLCEQQRYLWIEVHDNYTLFDFARELLASEDLLWRYYNDRRFHTFVQQRCAESIEAYKDHKPAPIPLNPEQKQAIQDWSKDSEHGDLWGNEEAREINLTTFARTILASQQKAYKAHNEPRRRETNEETDR